MPSSLNVRPLRSVWICTTPSRAALCGSFGSRRLILIPISVAAIVLNELASGAVRRLVVDDIAVLLHELGERTRDFLGALNNILYGADITSLYLLEIPAF